MKRIHIDQKISQPKKAPAHSKRLALWTVTLCLLTGIGVTVSMALLGSRLSRFSEADTNVITLVPTEGEVRVESKAASIFFKPKTERMQAGNAYITDNTDLAGRDAGQSAGTSAGQSAGLPAGQSDLQAGGQPDIRPEGKQSNGQSEGYQGELLVNDNIQTWSKETQVDLFRNSYSDKVQSDNGEKVIAPGTSNYYDFSLKNNGDAVLNYKISLEVETHQGQGNNDPAIPLEWRLLSGDEKVSDWRGYNDRTEVLKKATMDAWRQDNYTIEWRWVFEQGDAMNAADTRLGNMAVDQTIGVTATIYIYAEGEISQNNSNEPGDDGPGGDGPGNNGPGGGSGDGGGSNDSGQRNDSQEILITPFEEPAPTEEPTPGFGIIHIPGGLPKTGDTSHLLLYAGLMAGSILGLVVLLVIGKRRKKDKDTQDGQE